MFSRAFLGKCAVLVPSIFFGGCNGDSFTEGKHTYNCACHCFLQGPTPDLQNPIQKQPINVQACADHDSEAERHCDMACEHAARLKGADDVAGTTLECRNRNPQVAIRDSCNLDDPNNPVSASSPLVAFYASRDEELMIIRGKLNPEKSYVRIQKDSNYSGRSPGRGRLSVRFSECRDVRRTTRITPPARLVEEIEFGLGRQAGPMDREMAERGYAKDMARLQKRGALRTCKVQILFSSIAAEDIELASGGVIGYIFDWAYIQNHGIWTGQTLHAAVSSDDGAPETIIGSFQLQSPAYGTLLAVLSEGTSPTGAAIYSSVVDKPLSKITGQIRLGRNLQEQYMFFDVSYEFAAHAIKAYGHIHYNLIRGRLPEFFPFEPDTRLQTTFVGKPDD